MCKWGTMIDVKVFIPPEMSHTGEGHFAVKGIDACIAPLVKALNEAGLTTVQSCCGHGNGNGRVDLLDGRVITIGYPKPEDALMTTFSKEML